MPEEAIKRIRETKNEIGNLEGSLRTARDATAAQEALIRALEQAAAALNLQIAQTQQQLQLQEEQQRLVNDTLEQAAKWFIEDSREMRKLGGTAAEQADAIDEATRELLLAMTDLAGEEAGIALQKIRDLVQGWNLAKIMIGAGLSPTMLPEARVREVFQNPEGEYWWRKAGSPEAPPPGFEFQYPEEYHEGGMVPGPLNKPRLILAEGGEQILSSRQVAATRAGVTSSSERLPGGGFESYFAREAEPRIIHIHIGETDLVTQIDKSMGRSGR